MTRKDLVYALIAFIAASIIALVVTDRSREARRAYDAETIIECRQLGGRPIVKPAGSSGDWYLERCEL